MLPQSTLALLTASPKPPLAADWARDMTSAVGEVTPRVQPSQPAEGASEGEQPLKDEQRRQKLKEEAEATSRYIGCAGRGSDLSVAPLLAVAVRSLLTWSHPAAEYHEITLKTENAAGLIREVCNACPAYLRCLPFCDSPWPLHRACRLLPAAALPRLLPPAPLLPLASLLPGATLPRLSVRLPTFEQGIPAPPGRPPRQYRPVIWGEKDQDKKDYAGAN